MRGSIKRTSGSPIEEGRGSNKKQGETHRIMKGTHKKTRGTQIGNKGETNRRIKGTH
jgi:hypothetical protein